VTIPQVLHECLDRGLTFAAFRVPGEPITIWFQRDPLPALVDSAVLDNEAHAFVIAPFLSQMGHVHIVRADHEIIVEGSEIPFDAALMAALGIGSPTRSWGAVSIDRAGYMRSVEAAKAAISVGELEKVVLARTLLVPGKASVLPDLFLAAEKAHPGSLVSLIHTPLHGTWIGASPERLVVFDGDRFEIDSLAGTMSAANAPDDPAGWGTKELHEQSVVTQKILRRLGPHEASEVRQGRLTVVRAGNVAHLRTPITGVSPSQSRGLLATTIHPTPAICGEPVLESQKFILAHEPDQRGLYAGFWGPWRSSGRCDLHVNIRCMHVVDHGFAIHVGAGITQGSIAEREWEETELKARVWLDLIEAQRAAG
jgi:isochorismate synthase